MEDATSLCGNHSVAPSGKLGCGHVVSGALCGRGHGGGVPAADLIVVWETEMRSTCGISDTGGHLSRLRLIPSLLRETLAQNGYRSSPAVLMWLLPCFCS